MADGRVAIKESASPTKQIDNEEREESGFTVQRQRVVAYGPDDGDVPVTGPLTNTQLRATPVPTTALTDTELRNAPIGVTGPVTDTQLRAAPVDVAGPLTDTELRATPVPISGTVTATGTQTDALTDTELRAAPVPISGTVTADDNASEFWRIKNKRYTDTEEVRYDIAADLANGDIYTGVATDGTATSSATWTIIRTYFDANGNPSRERIRFNVAWDSRTAGW